MKGRKIILVVLICVCNMLYAQTTTISGAISIFNSCGNSGCDVNCDETSYYTIYSPQTACNGTAYAGNCSGGSPGTHYSTYISINIPAGCTATVTAEYGGPNNYTTTCSDSRMDAGGPDLVGISSGASNNPLLASWSGTTATLGGTSNIGTCSFGAGGNGSGATLNGGAGSTGCYTSGGGGNANVLCTATGIAGLTDVTVWGAANRGDEIITYTVTATGASCPLGVTVLPIELISFAAYQKDNGVNVKWATANEINNNYFVLEYSINALEFIPVKEIKGAGNSFQKKEYEYFFNEDIGNYIPYFRLKQVDYNGKFKYSPVIMSGTSYGAPVSRNGIVAFYNYKEELIVSKFSLENESNVKFELYDINGRKIFFTENKLYNRGDQEAEIDAPDQPGIYYLMYYASDKAPEYKKIVVQK
jgi:hypothetical protein